MAAGQFKTIVVGGGPSGLIAAHILYKSGIDFVVLESREQVVIDSGAAMVLGPQNLRVMQQLGLLEKLLPIGAENYHTKGFLPNGRVVKNVSDLKTFKDNHGLGLITFHRAQLVQTLYDSLPEKAKGRYLTNKKVVNIESNENGVRVTVVDGTVYEGSIVIGADGVHSVTRRIVRKYALAEDANREWDPENPFPAEYRCLWCSFPRPSEQGQCVEVAGKDLSLMYLTGVERGWIMAYDRFPKATIERHDYTEKDIEEFVEKIADYPVTEKLKIRDVFATRQTYGLSDLGEGIAKNWSWGRIVLVGDTIHKFTPNAGLGLNNAIQDIVALINGLHGAIKVAPNGQPDSETLTEVFKKYKEQRLEPLTGDYERSALVTRLQAWASNFHWFLNRYIFIWPFAADLLVNYIISPSVRKGLVLDYIPSEDLPKGKVAWEHQIPSSETVN